MAGYFDTLAEVCRAHGGWRVDGVDEDPPVAALIVLVSADGEPVPLLLGDAWWSEHQIDLLHDVEEALSGATWLRQDHQAIRERWLATEARRTVWRARKAAAEEELARTHPFLCDCGKRTKSLAGLGRHQTARHPSRTEEVDC